MNIKDIGGGTFALFGSLAVIVTKRLLNVPGLRPMTLRHQFSLVLLFGSRSLNDYLTIILEPWLCATSFRWFCSFGNLAILIIDGAYDVRPLALRRQISLVLLFSECNIIIAQNFSNFKFCA